VNQTRVRFAPSPTGYLHVGGARTLLFNWIYAKKTGGTLVLRVEDTDQARSTRESERMIVSDIERLGLDYQEGPIPGGKFEPYRQSERLAIYAGFAKKLLEENKVYFCFCSDTLLTQKREAAFKLGRVPHYDGTCSQLSKDEVQQKFSKGEKAGLRFRAPYRTFVLQDHVRERVEFKEGMVGDFLITRTPAKHEQEIAEGIGFPVYNFCCAIDDHLMELTQVIRAEEHLSNTVRQLMIYDALGWTPPEFVHISLVLGTDRQKLSKRSGDVSVYEYLDKGYLPEALLNFLLLLGWAPSVALKPVSGHPEIFTQEEMIAAFNFEGLHKAAAVFDIQKLNWMNSFYIKHMPLAEIVLRARPFFEAAGSKLVGRSEEWFTSVIEIVRGEVQLLSELPQAAELFLDSTPTLEVEAKGFLDSPTSKPVVEALVAELSSSTQDLLSSEVEALMKKITASTGVKGKALFMPVRAVITGKTHGPELKQILPLLGRETVLRRIGDLKKQAGLL
jgi:nondiscriminating glutamyl-tRNA synthetase